MGQSHRMHQVEPCAVPNPQEYLQARNERKYVNLKALTPRQGVVALIDNWFWKQALQITGKYEVNMLQREDISLTEICPFINRTIPHQSMEIRRNQPMEAMHITGDITKLFECCRKIAEFHTITGQLLMNGIMLRQTQVLA